MLTEEQIIQIRKMSQTTNFMKPFSETMEFAKNLLQASDEKFEPVGFISDDGLFRKAPVDLEGSPPRTWTAVYAKETK